MSKGKSKTYTTSELAGHFNISVVSASCFVVKRKLEPVKVGQHNAKYYSDTVFQQMEEHYQNEPKTQEKQIYSAAKDTIIKQLKVQIQERATTVELLKQQLTVKDEQTATTNKPTDQAQQLDLTIHKQQKSLSQPLSSPNETAKYNWF